MHFDFKNIVNFKIWYILPFDLINFTIRDDKFSDLDKNLIIEKIIHIFKTTLKWVTHKEAAWSAYCVTWNERRNNSWESSFWALTIPVKQPS